MYRKNYLQGCCLAAFGLGLMIGHSLESWLLCCGSGICLVGFGFCVLRKR